ncbi:arginine--tRNA ligase [Candidatus Pelagibacter sp.]|nr:arginine--tRNA ligase [Candidatus Pelagibacter sp.]
MNIFETYQDKIKNLILEINKQGKIEISDNLDSIGVDLPPSQFKAHISTNVAMVLSKVNKSNPNDLAKKIEVELLKIDKDIEKIEIVKPGFINITFKNIFWNKFIQNVINQKLEYGTNLTAKKKSFFLEFVSANPTGPLHVGHCRGAVSGDVLANILKFNKHKVHKEYYVNDYGNQIVNFTKSVYYRIKEQTNKEPFPKDNEDLYPGDYIIQIAKNIINDNKDLDFKNFEKISDQLTILAVNESIKIIKSNLKNIGIVHDKFQSEREIVNNNEVQKTVDKLIKKKFVYKGKIKAPEGEDKKNWVEREQLLFKSTDFGDDKDRALQKSDNSWTYFAGDVAYHENKLNRKYDTYINILGADHAGYIKRITASVEALSGEKNKLVCKVSQLVKLIKDGKPFKMSKRKGDYITVEDLIDEVGKDATRFIMLNRSSDAEIDFDFDKVKEKSKDNPLYYVQYCYARICSVFRHIGKEIDKDIKVDNYNFNFSPEDIDIYKKISEWPKCIEISSKKLEPHRVPTYLYELSSLFHSYWNMGKDDKSKRFISEDKKISDEKLVLLKSVSNVIKCGMNLVGASTPEKM